MSLTQHPETRADSALTAVARALEITDTHAARDAPNGFTWWIAPGLRQQVRIEAGAPDGMRWLRIETPLWSGADPLAIAPLLDALRQYARGAAVLHAPDSGDVTLVSRVPLPDPVVEARAAAFAGTGAIQAFLAAWAWGEARTRFGSHASWWRDALPHPELGMDLDPHSVLGYRDRVLRPQAEGRAGAFAEALLAGTADAIEHSGLGLMRQRQAHDKVVFGVDVGPTLGYLEVGLIRGPIDAHALAVAISLPGHLAESRAHACSHELILRHLAPGAGAWTLGSWMPLPRRDGRPGFGLTHGLFVPLALAEPAMVPELAEAAARSVDLVQTWFDDGAPAPGHLDRAEATAGERLVA
jgi:hypothetical protein